MLQQRVIADAAVVQSQLERALASRVVIEQAKGILAQRDGIGLDEAFGLLRWHARVTRTPLSTVAAAVVDDPGHAVGPVAP